MLVNVAVAVWVSVDVFVTVGVEVGVGVRVTVLVGVKVPGGEPPIYATILAAQRILLDPLIVDVELYAPVLLTIL